jgi:signal transduction histidine kinase
MTQQQCSEFGFSKVLHPEDAQHSISGWKECVQSGEIWDVECRFRGVDGKWHPILSRGVPVRNDRGQIVCWTGFNLDISRLKEAERALVRSEKLASVGRMASTIAHEINNPLETIGNVVYLAMTDPEMPPSARAHLEIGVQELERINHITRQTLAFHRETSTPTLIDLRTSVDTVLRLFEARLRSRGISVERNYRDAGCITAFGGEIQQVISNLLSNAMDATPEHGRIEFRLSCTGGGKKRFTIADTGSGISRERLARIFEPFFTTKEMYGTGLGLWVTRQIVEKHGGTIRVRSKSGRGTVFSMVFPVAEAA